MSERPDDRGSSEQHSNGAHDKSKRPRTASSPRHNGQRSVPSPADAQTFSRPGEAARTVGLELPPIPAGFPSGASANLPLPGPRLAGVASILNPVGEEPTSRRRKLSEIESPRGTPQSLPSIAMTAQTPTTETARRGPSPVSAHAVPIDRTPRRILTPRSPSLHRAASLSQLKPIPGTLDAHQAPFLSSPPRSRIYTAEPGVGSVPTLPIAPITARPAHVMPTTPSEVARRGSFAMTRPSGTASASASPTTSYSSYSQAGQTSPATQYAPPTTMPGPFTPIGDPALSHSPPIPTPGPLSLDRQRPLGIPISSSGGQNVYQMMTLETTSGTVQLPVDVQAASKMADEKRRRNAGASARFRQRRKEKEREAATTISKLEQRVKDLSEEVEFYRQEREYLSNVLIQVPGGKRHFPRPASPRRRRSSAPLPGPGLQASSDYGGGTTSESVATARSPENEIDLRRRTSTISLPAPPPPPPPSLSYPSPYNQQIYGPPIVPQPHPHQGQVTNTSLLPRAPPTPQQQALQPSHGGGGLLAPASSLPHLQPGGPPTLMQATPQTGPYNPYAPAERQRPPTASRE